MKCISIPAIADFSASGTGGWLMCTLMKTAGLDHEMRSASPRGLILRLRRLATGQWLSTAHRRRRQSNARHNAKRPSTFFSNFFLPTISNYSTRLNSAQLTNSSQLSSSYQPSNSTLVTNSSRLSSTNSQDYHLPHNKSGRGGREIFLVVAGSWLVVLDGCCALRASPSGSTQRGTAPRPLAPTFPATLRRHRRRPFAVNVRIPLDLQFPIACLQKPTE
jgi:hypothetical protein